MGGHGCPLSIWAVLETVGGLRGFEQSLSLWMFLVLKFMYNPVCSPGNGQSL